MGFDKLAANNVAAVTELQAKVGQGKDEAVKAWESKYGQLEKKYNDTHTLHENTVQEFTTFKEQAQTQIKGIKLTTLKDQAFGKLKFKSNITEVEKAGFHAIVESKYKLDFDDKGELYIGDKEGNRIKSASVTGAHKTIDEVLQDEAVKANVLAIAPKPGTPPAFQPPAPGTPHPGTFQPQQKTLPLNRRAIV